MNKLAVLVVSALILFGCSKEPKQELLGRYYGSIDFKPGKDREPGAQDNLAYMQKCSIFFYRPRKFRFETPHFTWSGNFEVNGDAVTLTGDSINGIPMREAKERLLSDYAKRAPVPEHYKRFVNWVTQPIVLKVDSDFNRVHETQEIQYEQGDFYYEKRG